MGNKYIMRNCYWRHEYQDMNATVPTCDYYGQYGSCLCSDECEHYISEKEVENIIRKRAEAGHSHEDGQWFDLTDALTVERNDWIPCSDRLPNAEYGESESVLCCTELGSRDGVYWNGGNWCVPTGEPHEWVNHKTGWHNKVIAWMPLPKPYREEREDYELATEQMEHDAMYEPTYNFEDGSM